MDIATIIGLGAGILMVLVAIVSGGQVAGFFSLPSLVLVLGGISAGRHVVESDRPGWWQEMMGPGRAMDTRQYRVLGIDFLGGSGMSTGPVAGQTDFPSISAYDQAEAIRQLLGHLGVAQLHAVIGASYGGMVGLAAAGASRGRLPQGLS